MNDSVGDVTPLSSSYALVESEKAKNIFAFQSVNMIMKPFRKRILKSST